MQRRFQTRAKAAFPRRFLAVGVLLALLLIGMELYRLIVPFVSANPLWSQVTIGQPVINHWAYGGIDEEGYLKFYNEGTSAPPVLLPPDAHLFDADGKFVILESHTASSLTYAQPYDAIPMKWVGAATGLLLLFTVFTWLRIRRRLRGMKVKRTTVAMGKRSVPWVSSFRVQRIIKMKRFRPRK